MRKVDAYLSRRAAVTWPGAVVYCEVSGRFVLERRGMEGVELGAHFGAAREALAALRRAAGPSSDRPAE